MNETASLLLASTILGVSGLCLYMYKTDSDKDPDSDLLEEFSLEELNEPEWNEPEIIEQKSRNSKTKRNKRSVKPSRRRY